MDAVPVKSLLLLSVSTKAPAGGEMVAGGMLPHERANRSSRTSSRSRVRADRGKDVGMKGSLLQKDGPTRGTEGVVTDQRDDGTAKSPGRPKWRCHAGFGSGGLKIGGD